MMVEIPLEYQKKMMRHVSRFYGLHCAIDIMDRNLFPNGKEITESMGAFFAVRNYLRDISPRDSEVALVTVGDGNTPRTASIFAFMTRWKCYSVDPILRDLDWNIDRLHVARTPVEQFRLDAKTVVVVSVHSHADMGATLKSITGENRSMVAIPCCVAYNKVAADVEYYDPGIWSNKNFV